MPFGGMGSLRNPLQIWLEFGRNIFGQDRNIASLGNVHKLVEYVRRETHNLESNTQPLLEKGFVAWGPPPVLNRKNRGSNTAESSGEMVERAVDNDTPAIWTLRILKDIHTAIAFYFLILFLSSMYFEKNSVDLFMWNHNMLPMTSVLRLSVFSRIILSTNDSSFGWKRR